MLEGSSLLRALVHRRSTEARWEGNDEKEIRRPHFATFIRRPPVSRTHRQCQGGCRHCLCAACRHGPGNPRRFVRDCCCPSASAFHPLSFLLFPYASVFALYILCSVLPLSKPPFLAVFAWLRTGLGASLRRSLGGLVGWSVVAALFALSAAAVGDVIMSKAP